MVARKTATRKTYVARINKVIDFIRENLDGDLSLENLSAVAAFSPYHFHRIFKAFSGENLNEFVNRQRIQQAAMYLKYDPDRAITDIALSCGFSSSSNFARAFKKYFGISASGFREGRYSKIGKTISKNGNVESNIREDLLIENEYTPIDDCLIDKPLIRRLEQMEVKIEQLPAYTVAYIRTVGGYGKPDIIGPAFHRVIKWAKTRDLTTAETLVIGIGLDHPNVTPIEKCRYDACVTVPEGTTSEGEIGVYDIPEGKYAIYRITGDYKNIGEDVGPAWNAMYGGWLPDSGYQPDDRPCFEIYLETKEEFEAGRYVIDLCVPIKPL